MSPSTSTTAPNPVRTQTLATLDACVEAPSYDRQALVPSIVHLGVGGFHRAHLATYIDELCRDGVSDWGIVGCGVLAGDKEMAQVLDAQDHLYTLIERGTDTTKVRIIGSIVDYIHAHPAPTDAIAQIADPRTQIVSLTITEGGYPIDDRTGKYLPDSPNTGPQSAFGVLVAGLAARKQSNAGPITIMSCDNIMTNGQVTRTATLGEAASHGPELVEWINESASFPNSMVDRITPATTSSDREWLSANVNIEDLWPVVTEPFRQWVIEDKFAGKRPPLESLDVIVTDDVEPYEFMKLRLLNAGHSCIAYLSALRGFETVHEAMADPDIAAYLHAFLHDEAKSVLPPVANIDIDDYISTTIERFRNPAIGDQIARLCLDGSAKFPKFLLPTLRAQLATDGPIELTSLAIAGWCQYLNGAADSGADIAVASDPNLEIITRFANDSIDDPLAFLAFDAVFDSTLANSERFQKAFAHALAALRSTGAVGAIRSSLTNRDGTNAAE